MYVLIADRTEGRACHAVDVCAILPDEVAARRELQEMMARLVEEGLFQESQITWYSNTIGCHIDNEAIIYQALEFN